MRRENSARTRRNFASDIAIYSDIMSRILLVEDDRDVCLLLQHVLLDAGYEVDCVASAGAARAHLADAKYDLVLTDGKLGDGSGIDVADDAIGRGMKALVVSGYMLQLSKAELDRHEFLMKPVRPSELLDAIERRLSDIAR
jgi:two-component system, NtrC family, response regulator HydG